MEMPPASDGGPAMHWISFTRGTLAHFLHAHPVPSDDGAPRLGWIPAGPGAWRGYLDLSRADGSIETIVHDYAVGDGGQGRPATVVGANDVVATAEPAGVLAIGGDRAPLDGGWSIERAVEEGAAFRAGEFYVLTFTLKDPQGRAAEPSPHEGARAHAFVLRHDGEVYVRLASSDGEPGVLRFPYGFPQPGIYRAWIEVDTGDGLRAGAFDLRVR